MNVLDLIRSKTLKEEHLHDAQFLMAKAYRGVPYVDAHHNELTSKVESKQKKEAPTQLRSAPDSGHEVAGERQMNVLDLIRSKILKKEHLHDAQFLMAKAYRGVPYMDAHHDDPDSDHETKHLTYRGQNYDH